MSNYTGIGSARQGGDFVRYAKGVVLNVIDIFHFIDWCAMDF